MTGKINGLSNDLIRESCVWFMYKIGVIGENDVVLGLKAHWAFQSTQLKISSRLQRHYELAKDNYAVIYITEQTAANILNDINEYREERFPAIIPIPGIQGNMGIGMQGVKKCVEKAVGADILFSDE